MFRQMMKSKIHRATVTEANLDYVGSITIDEDLMDAAGLVENEMVQVLNISNGNRLETYVIRGNRESGEICVNGAAAHLMHEGDKVIIVSYCMLPNHELRTHTPKIVHVDDHNHIVNLTQSEINFSIN